MNEIDYRKEVNEAINIGNILIRKIEEAEEILSSARNWGIFDMLSRKSLISSIVKHQKLDAAQEIINELPYYINRFNEELNDVYVSGEMLNVSMTGGIRFADWFFDNIFVDFYVQSHIKESQEQLAQLKEQVQRILNALVQF